MEKGFESWFQNQQIDPNLSSAPFGFHHRLNVPFSRNMFSPNVTDGNLPMFTFKATKPEEPRGWFNGFTPVVNAIPKELHEPQSTHEVQKKFLVFDQLNDRTTLIYSSTPIQYHLPKPHLTYDPKTELSLIEKHEDNARFSDPFLDDGNNEVSEMREDTEELRALLYSDDDETDYSEDEEEQSTGHSPNLVTGFDTLDTEEVASSTGCWKRHKLDAGGYDVVSLEDTASSGKSGVNFSNEAEFSSCGDQSSVGNAVLDVDSESFQAGKRARKEKVKETISILQNLIPGGNRGKDAMVILDEAINYLRILKVKAKALGLDSL